MTILSDSHRVYLAYPHYCVLATINKDGTPQLSTVWFELEGDELLFSLEADSLKIRNLLRDPRCAASIPNGGRFVSVKGTVTIIEDFDQGWNDLVRLGTRYYGTVEGLKQAEFLGGGDKHHYTVRLSIEKASSVGVG
ncbi:MAG: PPOX class F420-dependent oxidoreductase [Chloroflexi bacterium]|uniref:PPOX class F420-dependent oxidoreductase n=1 Tax=Candidatus Chlorohelix allophototropha TaxID=3003348 RepID=A0A8T7M614_9CHLR|nr:PPOX class F420-dependent oxidoreductase [Chloroflexota bacterium]WJW69461.1 PPOX class F420-dependent oxidoreductase [Chloroflexota bacterium L227-S17]